MTQDDTPKTSWESTDKSLLSNKSIRDSQEGSSESNQKLIINSHSVDFPSFQEAAFEIMGGQSAQVQKTGGDIYILQEGDFSISDEHGKGLQI